MDTAQKLANELCNRHSIGEIEDEVAKLLRRHAAAEVERLRGALENISWFAQRYCDGARGETVEKFSVLLEFALGALQPEQTNA